MRIVEPRASAYKIARTVELENWQWRCLRCSALIEFDADDASAQHMDIVRHGRDAFLLLTFCPECQHVSEFATATLRVKDDGR